MKITALLVPPSVVTVSGPVSVPWGTMHTIDVSLHEFMAAILLSKNLTLPVSCVSPKPVPVIVTVSPAMPSPGFIAVIEGTGIVTVMKFVFVSVLAPPGPVAVRETVCMPSVV